MFVYFVLIILLPGMGEGKPCSSWNSCRNCVSREQCIFVQEQNYNFVCVSRSKSFSEYRRVFRTRSRCMQLENGLTTEKPALEKDPDSRSENIPFKEVTANLYNSGEPLINSTSRSGVPEAPTQEPMKVQNREVSSASIVHVGKLEISTDITPHSTSSHNSIGGINHNATSQSTKPLSAPSEKQEELLNITTQLLSSSLQKTEVSDGGVNSSESTTSFSFEKLQEPLNPTPEILDSDGLPSQPTSRVPSGKLEKLDTTPQPLHFSTIPTEITDIELQPSTPLQNAQSPSVLEAIAPLPTPIIFSEILQPTEYTKEVQSLTPLQNVQSVKVLEPIPPSTTLKAVSDILLLTEIGEKEVQSSTPQQNVQISKKQKAMTSPTTPKIFSEIQLQTSSFSDISFTNTIRAINNERLQREIVRTACKLSLQQKGYENGMGNRWFKMSIVNPMGTKQKKCRRLTGKSFVQTAFRNSTTVSIRQKRKQLRKTACELSYLQKIYLYNYKMGEGWFAMSLANPMRNKPKECSRILRKRILL